MRSKFNRDRSSFLHRLVDRLLGREAGSAARRRSVAESVRRDLRFEPLEARQLLASDLASLTGIVSLGAGNPVTGATVELYADDGDGIFEPTGDDGPALATDITDGTGTYRFDRLAADGYFLRQPAQTIGPTELGEFVSSLITITPLDAAGVAGLVVDDFADAVAQTVTATDVTPQADGTADHAGALGGERDVEVDLLSGTPPATFEVTSSAGTLEFNSSLSGTGQFTLVYDGEDNDAGNINFIGLGGANLTQGGATALQIRVQADQVGATAVIRVYTDANNFSETSAIAIPANTPTDFVLEFASLTDFQQGVGATGAADFANVGAIEVIVTTTTDGTDGMVTLLGAFGPTVLAQAEITNEVDLSVTKTVDNPTPNVGDQVTFTVTVTNPAGGAGATNIDVTDTLPAGLSFVSANPDVGTFAGGVWSIPSLAAGATATLEIVADVTSSALLTNTAEITAVDQPDPDALNNSDTADIDAPAAADLVVTKTVDDDTPNPNQIVTYTITVTNDGPDQATGVQITDALPAGLNFQSAVESQGTYTSGTGIWDVGTLNSGAIVTLTIQAEVTSNAPIDNTASVTASDQFDPDAANNSDNAPVDVPPIIDLELAKAVDDPTPNVGDTIQFTITLDNVGPETATGVIVTDTLPAGLTFVTAVASQGSYDEITGLWTVGDVANGASLTLTIDATVAASGTIINTAEVTDCGGIDDSPPGDGLGDDIDTAQIDVPVAADLSIDKTVDNAAPSLGEDVVFTIVVTNNGPNDATGVVVTDPLPAGLTFVSANPAADYNSGTGVWTVGALASGASATLTITATVNDLALLTNTATITASDQFDPNANNNSDGADVDVPEADLSIDKTVDNAAPNVGDDVTFTIVVTNNGPDDATGVVVTDQLPAGLTFVSANPAADYNSATGVWTIGTLANGASATLTITATVGDEAVLTNTAAITASDAFDADTADNTDAADVDAPEADLSVDKTVDNAAPNVGDDVTFTIVVTNNGPNDATGVVVTDQLPAGLTFVSANPAADYNSATGVWTVGALANGASETLTITATVTAATAITNTATITASDVFDPDPADDSDTAQVDAPEADLSIVKTVDNAAQNVGDDVVFTIVVTNDGPNDATGVVVTDQLPAGLTFVSANPAADYNSATGVWTIGALANGASETLTITATVAANTAITNTATITASDVFDPDAADNTDTAQVDAPEADLSVTKSVNNATPNVGQNVVFTIVVTNTGPNNATGVVVTDQLPAGLTFVSANPAADYNSATGVWTVGALANGASETLTITATVTAATAITNTATITASDVFDPDQADNSDTAQVDAPSADLSLTKTVDNATPAFGSNVTFTVTLTNTGPDAATNVVVTDAIPAGLVLQSSNPAAGTTYNSATGQWSIPSLASGANVVLTLVARVNSTAAITNVAEVTASGIADPDSTPNNGAQSGEDDRATAVVDAAATADLRLAKSANDTTLTPGQQVTFTIVLTNDGPDTATGVSVLDQLPTGLSFVNSTQSQGAYNSGTGVWSVGDLASGATATLTLTATYTGPGSVTNTAQVSASGTADPDSTPNNSAAAEDDQASVTLGRGGLSKRQFLAR